MLKILNNKQKKKKKTAENPIFKITADNSFDLNSDSPVLFNKQKKIFN